MKCLIFFITTCLYTQAFGQNTVAGLYGDCKSGLSHYICQQTHLKEDGSFIFYDLLHLQGWRITEGNWKQNGDTIILNSLNPVKRPIYEFAGSSFQDSLNVLIYSKEGLLPFSNVTVDTINFVTNLVGLTKIPKICDMVEISSLGYLIERIELDPLKVKNIDTLKVKLIQGFKGNHIFKNEKWLLKDSLLFYTYENGFDSSGYFVKVSIEELKYRTDY